MRRVVVLLTLFVLAAAPVARGDGDPASDYLLGQSTFIPFDDGIPKEYAQQLANTVAEAKARGYAIRVAVIGTRYDMGSVTVLYDQPKRYAHFLGQELFFVYKGRLLVVMPNGLAVAKGGKPAPAEQSVVDRIPPPGKKGAALAAAATSAVVKLAANAGVVFSPPPLGSSGGSSATRDRLEIAGIVLVVVLLLAAAGLVRRRRRTKA